MIMLYYVDSRRPTCRRVVLIANIDGQGEHRAPLIKPKSPRTANALITMRQQHAGGVVRQTV